MLNFTWWVNRNDARGRNIFQGGFLGLDNIGIFDRSMPLPTGGYRLSSPTAPPGWRCTALDLMRIAIELAYEDPIYEDIAGKLFAHFLLIAAAMTGPTRAAAACGTTGRLLLRRARMPDGSVASRCARAPWSGSSRSSPSRWSTRASSRSLPGLSQRLRWLHEQRPRPLNPRLALERAGRRGTSAAVADARPPAQEAPRARMLDETEFLSPHGIRSCRANIAISPSSWNGTGATLGIAYWPGESRSKLFGGNSNWRGPVWMPINFLLIEACARFHGYYGPTSRSNARRAPARCRRWTRSPTT